MDTFMDSLICLYIPDPLMCAWLSSSFDGESLNCLESVPVTWGWWERCYTSRIQL
jgi:hypothetical protein